MRSRFDTPVVNHNYEMRSPFTAAALSVVPGLGHLYNGQTTKAFLYMDVAAVNFALVCVMLLTKPICETIKVLSKEFHSRPNEELLNALQQLHIGSAASNLLMLLIVGFIVYAARDAYDLARHRRTAGMYGNSALDICEAASGSYLFHLASIATCALLALFFILPPPPTKNITMIEFIPSTEKPLEHLQHKLAPRVSTTAEKNASHADLTKPVRRAESKHSETSAAHAAASAPKPPVPHVTRSTAGAPPQPHPVENPTPRPVAAPLPRPVALPHPITPPSPTPMKSTTAAASAAPSQPVPRPVQIASAAIPSPMPLPASPVVATAQPMAPRLMGGGAQTGAPTPVSHFGTAGVSRQSAPQMITTGMGSRGATGGPEPAPAQSMSGRGGHNGSDVGEAPHPVAAGSLRPGKGQDMFATRPVGAASPGKGDTDSPANAARPGTGHSIDAAPVDFGPYMADLQRRIKSRWSPTKINLSNRVQVTFSISIDGELSNLVLRRGPGNADVDQAALRAVREAAPFRHLPVGSESVAENGKVQIEFTFDYNVFGGNARERMSNSIHY